MYLVFEMKEVEILFWKLYLRSLADELDKLV